MLQEIINATFTGLGTAIGLTLFEFFIKPYLHKGHRNIKHYTKYVKRLFHGRTR